GGTLETIGGQAYQRHASSHGNSGHNNHEGRPRREHRWSEGNSLTVFVDNLPVDSTKAWLWKVFSSAGNVVDTFLSVKKRMKNPLRFAFVRYATKWEVNKAIEQLNGWIVWGHSILVTESKYKRSWVEERNNMALETGRGMKDEVEGLSLECPKEAQNEESDSASLSAPPGFEPTYLISPQGFEEWSNLRHTQREQVDESERDKEKRAQKGKSKKVTSVRLKDRITGLHRGARKRG
ncbi:hypothetical protein PIB30_079358, partial [Stylosanthes scabra]|nr:hypothetical protein [Stylosanthes scabra]